MVSVWSSNLVDIRCQFLLNSVVKLVALHAWCNFEIWHGSKVVDGIFVVQASAANCGLLIIWSLVVVSTMASQVPVTEAAVGADVMVPLVAQVEAMELMSLMER